MGHLTDAQDAVFRLLADPATHNGFEVRRIDTHISSVFLAGKRAFKVKRAVRFPFVDFSTLEKRKAACELELQVNRPFAPEIYRRMVPITRAPDGQLALDGAGTPVEWAVEMLRFDENLTLDHLAEAAQIDNSIADALGRAVAAAHKAAPVVKAGPWIEALASFIEQNDKELRETPDLFTPERIALLHEESRWLFERVRPLLAARGKLGLVRRGHGDLHLGNIVMLGDRPVLFDAIEFDPLIAAGDVLYDLAFLLMDLVERGLPEAANVVLNRYLNETRRLEDLDALTALPLFLSLRAAIRAKVTAARLKWAQPAEGARIGRSARAYFDLACGLIKPPSPMLIAIGGLSGTGKSALAKALAPYIAPTPGAVVLRSDVERKVLFDRAETEQLPPSAYAADVSTRVYATLDQKARRVASAGHSVIVDAVFAQSGERRSIAEIAQSHAVRFLGLFLTADLPTRLARVGARGPDASDANARVVREQENYALDTIDWAIVDASGTPGETLERAKSVLKQS